MVTDDLMARLRKKAAETTSRIQGGSVLYDYEEGPNRLRPLWNKDKTEYPWREVATHPNVGPNNAKVICPRLTHGLKCGICEIIDELNRGSAEDKATAKMMKAKIRVYMIILAAYSSDKGESWIYDKSAKVWGFPGFPVWETVCVVIQNPMYGNIFDAKTGRDLLVDYTSKDHSKSGYPEYKVLPLDRSEIPADVWSSIKDDLPDLEMFAKVIPYGATLAALEGRDYDPNDSPDSDLNVFDGVPKEADPRLMRRPDGTTSASGLVDKAPAQQEHPAQPARTAKAATAQTAVSVEQKSETGDVKTRIQQQLAQLRERKSAQGA